MEKMTQIVIRAQGGDSEAMNELFNANYNNVYYFALKNVQDAELACDITQETFIEVINTLSALQDPASFLPWIRSITYHQCTRYFKKKKDVLVEEEGSTIFDDLQEDRTEFIPDQALDQQDFRKTIMGMIDRLSDEQRSAVMLYYYDELPVKTIAEIQGVSESAVKSRLAYARKAIKASVEDYEKKNNVRLHSVAILPLLLWLFAGSAQTMPEAAAETMAQSISRSTGQKLSTNAQKSSSSKTTQAKKGNARGMKKGVLAIFAAVAVALAVIIAIFAGGKPGKTNQSGDIAAKPIETEGVWVRTKSTKYGANGEKASELQYTYDQAYNLTEKNNILADGSNGAKSIYHYDESNNLIEIDVTNADGSQGTKNIYNYDEHGNLIEEYAVNADGTQGTKYIYSYDDRGNIVEEQMIYADGSVYQDCYTYDSDNCLIAQLTVSPREEEQIFYDKDGNIIKTVLLKYYTNTSGWYLDYTYDNDRLTDIVWYKDSGEVYQRRVYSYDETGRNVRIDYEYTTDQSEIYDAYTVYILQSLDENGKIIKEISYDQNNLELYGEEYVYDAQGNILKKDTFRNLNTKYGATRRTELNHYTYEYDENGNMTKSIHTYDNDKWSHEDKEYIQGCYTETFVYDENGNLTEWNQRSENYNFKDYKTERKVYAYDDNSHEILFQHYKNDVMIEQLIKAYDDNDHMTLSEVYEDGTLRERSVWTYDENGNLSEFALFNIDILSYRYTYEYEKIYVSPDRVKQIQKQQEKL